MLQNDVDITKVQHMKNFTIKRNYYISSVYISHC